MTLLITLLIAALFALLGAFCVLLVAIGLPGAWILLAVAVVIEIADPLWLAPEQQPTFSTWVLLTALALALLGEILEFVASALGAKHGGASRRGMVGSIVGAVIGGIAGTIFLAFLPIIGSVLGACVGAGLGAMAGEVSAKGGTITGALRPAQGAAIGRLVGTVAKLPCAIAVWLLLTVAAFWP